MAIRVFTLPGLRIVSPAGEVGALAGRRLPRALLVHLAVERSASRETLLALLWPERDEERARHSLSQTVYDLRRILGDEALLVTGESYAVPPAVETDVGRFEAAVAAGSWSDALEVYGGAFLEGAYLAGTHPFEEWVERRSAQLARLHRRARRALLAERLEEGDLAGALVVAERWAELEPLEDEAHQRAIELLARLGRRSEALRQYELFRGRLQAAALEPMPELTQLVAGIAASAAGAQATTSFPATPAQAATSPAPAPVRAGTSQPEQAPVSRETASPARASVPARGRELALSAGAGVLVGVPAALLAAGVLQAVAPSAAPLALRAGVLALAGALAGLELVVGAVLAWRARGQRRARLGRGGGTRRQGVALGLALGALVALTAAYVVAPGRRAGAAGPPLAWSERPQPELGPPRKVALTRFQNRAGEAALEPVGRMAEDWIARQLRSMPEAEVVAEAPATAADSTPAAIARLARRTGADLVVFGRYYRDGADVLVSARLVPAPGSRVPPGVALEEIGPVRSRLDDPASAAAQLAARVAGAVAAECLFPECVRGRTPPSYEAWRAWVDAHAALRETHDLAATERGYRRSIGLDSTFVPAFTDLARLYLQDGRCPKVDSLGEVLEGRPQGVSEYDLLAMRAMRATCRNDRDAALDDRVQAWQLEPADPGARFALGAAAAAAGRVAEAEEVLAPLAATPYAANPGYYFVRLQLLHVQGKYEDELRMAEEARGRVSCACDVLFGLRALAALGRTAELEARIAGASRADLREPSVAELYRWMAVELEWHGHAAAARRFALQALGELEQYPAGEREATEYRVRRASVLLQLGRWTEARRALQDVRVSADAPRIVPQELVITKATILALGGVAAAKAGDAPAARAALAGLERLPDADVSAPGVATREVCEAAILAALGERAEAFRRIDFGRAQGTVPRVGLEPLAHGEILLRDLWHDPALGGATAD